MSNIGSWQKPVFLDGNDESPQELPLMVTRHTLRSMGLTKGLFEQLSAGAPTDEQTDTNTTKAERQVIIIEKIVDAVQLELPLG